MIFKGKEAIEQEKEFENFMSSEYVLRGKPAVSIAYDISELFNGSRHSFIEDFKESLNEADINKAYWEIKESSPGNNQLYVNIGSTPAIYKSDLDVISSMQYMDYAGKQAIYTGFDFGKSPQHIISTHNFLASKNGDSEFGRHLIFGNKLEEITKGMKEVSSDLKTLNSSLGYGKEGRVYAIRG